MLAVTVQLRALFMSKRQEMFELKLWRNTVNK